MPTVPLSARDGLLIFHSLHKVMRAEQVLKAAGFDVRLLPVPRQLSSDCGLALECRLVDRDGIEVSLAAAQCGVEEAYVRAADRYERAG